MGAATTPTPGKLQPSKILTVELVVMPLLLTLWAGRKVEISISLMPELDLLLPILQTGQSCCPLATLNLKLSGSTGQADGTLSPFIRFGELGCLFLSPASSTDEDTGPS
jgi:hypothetical protein